MRALAALLELGDASPLDEGELRLLLEDVANDPPSGARGAIAYSQSPAASRASVGTVVGVYPPADGLPRLPRDPEDDRREQEADQGIARREARGDHRGARDDSEADVGVSLGVSTVGHERWTVEAIPGTQTDLGGQPVADETDRARRCKGQELVGPNGIEEPVDRLGAGYAGAHEDREYNSEPRPLLRPRRPQREGDADRNRGCGIAEVVDQVGEQGDAVGGKEKNELRHHGEAKDPEREPDRTEPRMGPRDRAVHQAMHMAMPVLMPRLSYRFRAAPGPRHVAVATRVSVIVNQPSVTMQSRATAGRHAPLPRDWWLPDVSTTCTCRMRNRRRR